MENLKKAQQLYKAYQGKQSLGPSRKRVKKIIGQTQPKSSRVGGSTRAGYANQPGRGRNSAQIRTTVAPLQVGAVMGGPIVNFGSAASGNMRGLKMQGSQAWLDVGNHATVVSTPLSLPGTTATSNSVQFNPNQVTSMPPPLSNLAANFQRYRLLKLTLRYEPVCPTTDPQSYALAWVNDPDIPLSLTNTFVAVQGIQNSITFPAYQAWQMDVPIASQNLIWMVDNSTDARFNSPGMVVCCEAFTAAAARKGTLFMDYTIDLFDMTNVTGAALTRCNFCRELTPAVPVCPMPVIPRRSEEKRAHWDDTRGRYLLLDAPRDTHRDPLLASKMEFKATSMHSERSGDEDVELVEVPPARAARSTQDPRTPANTPAGNSLRSLSLK